MHPDVQSILALQHDDIAIYELEDRLASLEPRLAALEREREKVSGRLVRVRAAVGAEESKHREAMARVETHKGLVERSQRAYESVTSPKEANAAVVQLEQTKRMVAESERDANEILARITEMRHEVASLEKAVAAVEEEQASARATILEERDAIKVEMESAMKKRNAAVKAVPRALLSKYDRVRVKKRAGSVAPLHSNSCSACNTAIPTQRRAGMSAGNVELCEGCGVLLYAGE